MVTWTQRQAQSASHDMGWLAVGGVGGMRPSNSPIPHLPTPIAHNQNTMRNGRWRARRRTPLVVPKNDVEVATLLVAVPGHHHPVNRRAGAGGSGDLEGKVEVVSDPHPEEPLLGLLHAVPAGVDVSDCGESRPSRQGRLGTPSDRKHQPASTSGWCRAENHVRMVQHNVEVAARGLAVPGEL